MPGFYADEQSRGLRFGDVVRGFPVATPAAHEKEFVARTSRWSISISQPAYLVVMTPCCSIEDRCLVLAPLMNVRAAFYKNPFFEQDLTRINGRVPPEKSVPPTVWDLLPPEERSRRLAAGESYAFPELFIYAPHLLLDKYRLDRPGGSVEVGHYLLDFKCMFRVDCKHVNRDAPPPAESKVLELTIPTRQALREKTSLFFGRVPDEDRFLV